MVGQNSGTNCHMFLLCTHNMRHASCSVLPWLAYAYEPPYLAQRSPDLYHSQPNGFWDTVGIDDGLNNVVGAFDELGAPLGRSRKYPLLLAYSYAAFAIKIPLPYLRGSKVERWFFQNMPNFDRCTSIRTVTPNQCCHTGHERSSHWGSGNFVIGFTSCARDFDKPKTNYTHVHASWYK